MNLLGRKGSNWINTGIIYQIYPKTIHQCPRYNADIITLYNNPVKAFCNTCRDHFLAQGGIDEYTKQTKILFKLEQI